MKVAYASARLRGLCSSNAALQQGCGPAWEMLGILLGLMRSVDRLAALAALPAVHVLPVAPQGSIGYVALRCGDVEVRVQAVDDDGQVLANSATEQVMKVRRVLLMQVLIRGVAINESRTA